MNQVPGAEMGRSFRTVAIASFFLSVTALCAFEIVSVDFGWHIKTGEVDSKEPRLASHRVLDERAVV